MAEEFDWKKDQEESRYRRNLLKAILFSSRTENSLRFPTKQELILSEFVNGVIDYVGGKGGKITFMSPGIEIESYEQVFYKYLQSELEEHSDEKLNTKIRTAIDKLCNPYSVHCAPERPYNSTELYKCFKERICPLIFERYFSLPEEDLIRVQKKIIPLFSEEEKRDIEGIGRAMRKYIDQDLGSG